MSSYVKGKNDHLVLGDYNARCYQCNRKYKASQLRRHWEGYYVCVDCWEPRHPQDFVRGTKDEQTPAWTQSYNDVKWIPGQEPD